MPADSLSQYYTWIFLSTQNNPQRVYAVRHFPLVTDFSITFRVIHISANRGKHSSNTLQNIDIPLLWKAWLPLDRSCFNVGSICEKYYNLVTQSLFIRPLRTLQNECISTPKADSFWVTMPVAVISWQIQEMCSCVRGWHGNMYRWMISVSKELALIFFQIRQ